MKRPSVPIALALLVASLMLLELVTGAEIAAGSADLRSPLSAAMPPSQGDMPPLAEPVRIRFASGAVSAVIAGDVGPLESDLYVLAARRGQTLEAFVDATGVLLNVWGPDGAELIPGAMQMAAWRVVLPANGDYFIAVNSTGRAADYELTVIVDALTSGKATRIQFAPGGTSATVSGKVAAGAAARYVLRAQAGQTMEVNLSPSRSMLFAITGADGAVPKTFAEGSSPFRVLLARSQDYYVELVSPGAAASYRLTVSISPLGPTPAPKPVRINFASGATSAEVSGHVDPWEADTYVLRALAGQTMDVAVYPMGGPPCLGITGPGSAVLKRCSDPALEWHGKLPATGDYLFELRAAGSQANYILNVAISALRPKPTPKPTRIQFAPGATSAVVEGSLRSGESARYVLRALRGQTMMLSISTTSALTKRVDGPGGAQWDWPFVENHPQFVLPTTGDYIITLTAVEPGMDVRYTMEMVIPPR